MNYTGKFNGTSAPNTFCSFKFSVLGKKVVAQDTIRNNTVNKYRFDFIS